MPVSSRIQSHRCRHRRVLSLLLGISFFSLVGFRCPESCVAAKLNVVLILADDLGWRDLSVEGSTFYESPNVDRIANTGMRFTNGYATCQVCSPSRASIMTGKYPARLSITDWIGAAEGSGWKRNTQMLPATYQHQLPTGDTTLAEAFREGGYRTFFAGKWHLGGQGSLPEDHGFDINIGGHHRGSPPGGFFSPYNNPKMRDGPPGESLTLRLGEETAKFIRDHQDTPFFACLSFYAVHAPLQTTKSLWQKYQAKVSLMPKPAHRFIVDRTSPVRQVQDHPVYAGMVEAMDNAVGTVLSTLDELGLADNTVVVFTSDNGGVSAGDGKATSNLPLRGGKGRQWEGGVREPYYVYWPGVTRSQTCDTPVTGTDFYPTLCELAGLPARPEQHVDGLSLVPLLKGDAPPQPLAQRPLFWHYPHYGNQGGEPSSIIHVNHWKLIHYFEDDRNELYDLDNDPGERHNVATSHPDRVVSMHNQLSKWRVDMNARFPVPNPNFDVQTYRATKAAIRTTGITALEREHAAVTEKSWKAPNSWWGSERPSPGAN